MVQHCNFLFLWHMVFICKIFKWLFICWSSDRCKKQSDQEYVYSIRNWAQRDKDHSKGGLSLPVQPCPWSLVYSEQAGLLLLRQEWFTIHRKGWSSGMEKHSHSNSLALLSRWKRFLHTPPHPPFSFLAAEYTKQSTALFYKTQTKTPRWDEAGLNELW